MNIDRIGLNPGTISSSDTETDGQTQINRQTDMDRHRPTDMDRHRQTDRQIQTGHRQTHKNRWTDTDRQR